MKAALRSQPQPCPGGFSLIEIAAAIAIIAFAFVGLIGLATQFMQQGAESTRRTTLVTIARAMEREYRTITAEAQAHRANQSIYLFSGDGRFLGIADGEPPQEAIYCAAVSDATPAALTSSRLTQITLYHRHDGAAHPAGTFFITGRLSH